MELQKLKDLFQDPDVREALNEHVATIVVEEKKKLSEATEELNKQIASHKKKLFILQKSVLAKANLYERKLSELYELKFTEAKKALAKETQLFIAESVKNIQTVVEEEIRTNGQAAKLTEAFATAMRAVAPYVQVSELAEANTTRIEELTATVNKLMKERSELLQKALVADVHALVVAECAGYPVDKQAVILKTVTKLNPTSLTEAKTLVDQAKDTLREQEEEAAKLTEAATKQSDPTPNPVEAPDRSALKNIVESATKKDPVAPATKQSMSAKNVGYELVYE